MAEQCLDDMHWVIVVDIFGCKYPTAVVRQQYARRAIGALGFGNNGDFTNAAADRLDAGGTWMPDVMKKVRCGWSWTLLLQIPMVASRYGVAIVERFTWRMISARTRPRLSPMGITRERSNFEGLMCSR